ncbi:hypothetical protein [uncultured Amphritea sp.]|uniref:hypothetical protein n=1 Tax=uncultured Amphritea sp. TaxID=981605 RepID=UPI0025D14AB6|nr:hypothetical protein [uncultured Amphritea sp.]
MSRNKSQVTERVNALQARVEDLTPEQQQDFLKILFSHARATVVYHPQHIWNTCNLMEMTLDVVK